MISLPDYKARAEKIARERAKQFAKRNPGTAELRKFIREFDKFPAELRREMRPMLRDAGKRALTRARSNASWSSRIPRSLRISVTFSKRTAGVTLTSNRNRAPHGRPFANLGREGFFRVPVPNSPGKWARVRARPWFFSVADKELHRNVDTEIGRVVDTTARSHGFK